MKPNRTTIQRYRWAGAVAETAMGKLKRWGDKPVSAATEDPLAWWLLTELIATGGPTHPHHQPLD